MKSLLKSFIKFLSLSVVLSSLVFGSYAQSKNSDLLAINNKTGKIKTSSKTNSLTLVMLSNFNVAEETQNFEDWMFNLKVTSNSVDQEQQLEEWMFDSHFWKIERNIWNEEVIEEEREIEEWMKNFKIKQTSFMSIDIYSDFEVKEWMKKHSFIIL